MPTLPEPVLEVASAAWAACEPVLARFEAAWRQGSRPAIEDYLPPAGEHRTPLLLELVHTDLEFRLKASEGARVEEYLRRYPELCDAGAGLVGLITAEYRLRRQHGDAAPLDEYHRRFPGQGDRLLGRLGEETAREQPSGSWPPGSRLGKYELLEVVGQGSFGVVYRTRDTELDRTVAVKLPRLGQLATAEDEERFLREARSAARLRHPNLVALYDAGRLAGTCYLASEFVDGPTLAQRLAAGRPTCTEAAELLARVADALHYAHQQGVIHRDLKPANILLQKGETTEDTENTEKRHRQRERTAGDALPARSSVCSVVSWTPKITDFGLAKRDTGDATRTQEGVVLGTPAYMAPEQARGDISQVDARSDVWSLGVILYELLTGEVPFRGSSRMVLAQVLEDEPRPPRRLNEAVPADLEKICLKALTKEPAQRYPMAAAFADDLRRFLRGEPVQARPVGVAGRLWRWGRRKPVIASLTAGLALAVVLGLSGVTWQWRQAEGRRAEAEGLFRQAHQALLDFQRLAEVGEEILGSPHQFPQAQRFQQALRDRYLEYCRALASQRGEDPRVQASLARAYLAWANTRPQGALAERIAAFRNSLALWEKLAARDLLNFEERGHMSSTVYYLGVDLLADGQLPEAYETANQALASRKQLYGETPTDPSRLAQVTLCHELLGRLHRAARRDLQALAAFEQTQSIWEQLHRDSPKEPKWQHRLGINLNQRRFLYVRTKRPDKARACCDRALEIYQRLVREQPAVPSYQRFLADTYGYLAELQQASGEAGAARHSSQKALAIWENLVRHQPSDPRYQASLAVCHFGIALTRLRMGELAEARPSLEAARVIWEQLVQQDPSRVQLQQRLAQCYKEIGTLHRRTGQLADALTWLQKAQNIQDALVERLPDLESRLDAMAFTLRQIGEVKEEMGRPAEAIAFYQRAVQIEEQLPLKRRRTTQYRMTLAGSWHIIGRAYIDLGQPAEAVPFYEKAIALRESLCNEDTDNLVFRSNLCGTLGRFGLALGALDRRTEALAVFQRSIELREELLRDKPDWHNDRFGLAETYHDRGRLLEAAGQREDAVSAYEQAVHQQRLALERAPKPEQQKQLEVYSAARDRLHRQRAAGNGTR